MRWWTWALGLVVVAGAARGEGLYTRPVLRIEAGMHTAPIKAITVDAAGEYVVTASDDKTARVWRAADGALLRVLRPPIGAGGEGRLYAGAISPDGRWVALGGWLQAERASGHLIYVFDRAEGRLVRRLAGPGNVVNQLVFSPDGRRLAAVTGAGGLHVYRVADWRHSWQSKACAAQSYGVAFTRSGVLQSCDDGHVRRFDADADADAALQATSPALMGKEPMHISVGPAGAVAVGFDDASGLQVLDGDTLRPTRAMQVSYGNPRPTPVAAWLDTTLLAAGYLAEGGRKLVLRWPTLDGRPTAHPVADNAISALTPLPDGRLAWASGDPAWGLLSFTDGPQHTAARPILDLRGVTLAADAPGQAVNLAGGGYLDRPLTLDLARGVLRPDAARGPLRPPRTAGLSIDGWQHTRAPTLDGRALPLKQYERSRSLSIAPDGQHFTLGADWSVRHFTADGRLQWTTPTPGAAWAVNHSGDGRWVIAAVGDGTLRWYRARDGALLLSAFVHRDLRRWIAWTPAGYYDAAPGAEDLLGWHVNRGPDAAADFFPAERYRHRFFCPAMIPAILRTADPDAALAAVKDECRRMAPAGLTETMQAPIIEVLDPAPGAAFSGDVVAVRVRVRSPSGQPVHLDYRVDGRQLRAAVDPGPALRDGETTTLRVPMPERDATVVVFGRTRFANSEPVALPLRYVGRAPPPPPKPDLYVLAVGVSAYASARWADLKYPASDARRFSELWRDDPLYATTHIRVLPDGEATWQGIMGGVEWLVNNVTERDVAVVYLGGHGKIHPADNSYAFLPSDADPKRKLTTWLKEEHYKGPLEALPGKTLLFIDTCHAGAAGGAQVAMRGADLTELINELTDAESGLIVFAASNGRQPAQESPLWGGGAFTNAILSCATAPGERRFDGAVTHKGLGQCVHDKVLELTERDQRVVVVVPPGVEDYPVLAPR